MWRKVATDLGWPVTRDHNRPVVDGANRPSVPEGIDQLLTDTRTTNIGKAMWGYLSGVDHVTWFALRQAFITEPEEPDGLNPSLAQVGTQSRSVYIQSFLLSRGLHGAAEDRVGYMGWDDADFREASQRFAAHEMNLLQRVISSG